MKLSPSLTPQMTAWILRQPVFFIASAPTHGRHVNVSPKGLAGSTLRVLSPTRVAYLDTTGSGCETIAHLYENGRATLMFMSFGTAPRIARLFCTGRVVEWADAAAFDAALGAMGCGRPPAARAVIVLDVHTVQTSCGFGVPRVRRELYAKGKGEGEEQEEAAEVDGTGSGGGTLGPVEQFQDELSVFEDRPTLREAGRRREKAGDVLDYQMKVNLDSLDGLPGLRVAMKTAGHSLWLSSLRAQAKRIMAEREGIAFGFGLAVLVYLLGYLLSTGAVGAASGRAWASLTTAAAAGDGVLSAQLRRLSGRLLNNTVTE